MVADAIEGGIFVISFHQRIIEGSARRQLDMQSRNAGYKVINVIMIFFATLFHEVRANETIRISILAR